MKLTHGEISYILGRKKKKFDWLLDWMTEGVLEEADGGYGYNLTVYLKKPAYYIIRPLLTPPYFIYLVLEEGVKEAKEELKNVTGREIVSFHLHVNESTKKEYEKAKFIKWVKGE